MALVMNIEINKKKREKWVQILFNVGFVPQGLEMLFVVVAFYSIILLHDVDYYIPDEY